MISAFGVEHWISKAAVPLRPLGVLVNGKRKVLKPMTTEALLASLRKKPSGPDFGVYKAADPRTLRLTREFVSRNGNQIRTELASAGARHPSSASRLRPLEHKRARAMVILDRHYADPRRTRKLP